MAITKGLSRRQTHADTCIDFRLYKHMYASNWTLEMPRVLRSVSTGHVQV